MTLYSFNLLQFLAILFFIIFIFWYFLLSFRSYTYNLLSSKPILYFLFYFIFFCKKKLLYFFFFFFERCSRIIERFLSWNFYSIIATSFPKNFCNTFPRNLSRSFLFFFFFCNFLFQKFQSCFSYCSNSLFSKLSFNVTLPFLHIFSLIKCRFLCKIKFLWTWLKKWSLNRNLHYSSNTIMHTRKNTLNIFACRAFSRYISFQFLHKCINVRLFNYRYQKKKKKKFLFEFLI